MDKKEIIEFVTEWFMEDGVFENMEILAVCGHRADAEMLMKETPGSGIKAISGRQHEMFFVVRGEL